MKFFTTLKKYFNLGSAQKKFITMPHRRFDMMPTEIINFLKPMADYDFCCDQSADQLFKLIIASIILLIAGGFVVGNDETAGVSIMLVAALTLLFAILARIILGRINIHNSLRDFILPLICAINEDAAQNTNMKLNIDLTGKMLKAKMQSSKRIDPGWFSYPKITTSIYRDPWFDLQFELLDGSFVHIAIDDQVTSRHKTYRASGGKIKSKTKNKLKQMIKTTVSLRKKKYSIKSCETLDKICDRFKQKDGNNRQTFAMTVINRYQQADHYPGPGVCLNLVGKVMMQAAPALKGKR